MHNGLRVRLTLVVTVAVGLALAGASVWLVTGMSRTLVGDVEELASTKVDAVADALRAGQPVSSEPPGYLTVIQIQDERGQVVQQIPPSPSGTKQARGDDDAVVASRTVSTPDGERTVVAVSRLGPLTHGVTVVIDALLVATPLLTIFVGALTWFAVHRALRPVEAIRRRAEVISHSTLTERLPRARTGDEVARLTDTLNEMLGRIAEGARRQREFVSDASHELRTPLAAMRVDLEVSLARPETADWPALCRRLLDDHRRLDRLTGDLLTLARLDDDTGAGATPEPVRLDEIVAGELPAVRRSELTVDLAPAVVLGVEPQLARLVRNLLDNADRHAAGETHVRLAVAGDTVTLTVDDDGPGIPATQRDLVFDRFVRLDTSRTNTTGGTGIGLAIADRIVRNHHGTITVHTAPIGGARFEVTLSAFPKVG